MKVFCTPLTEEDIRNLNVGDMVYISGEIFCGRDAVLPKLVQLLESYKELPNSIKLEGSVIFHTAVSEAGVGPTSSNKLDIESCIPMLSKSGVKLHLGKGQISDFTVQELDKYNSVFGVIPPITALLKEKTLESSVVAYESEGMEALHKLNVLEYPVIIAAAHGRSIYS